MERLKEKIIFYYDSTVKFFADTLTASSTTEGFLRYFKNTGWLFIGKMSGLIASFLVGIYVARYLGPSRYGLLTYASSFTGLFVIFASFGIDNILSRELISNPEKREELLGSGFIIKVIGAIFSLTLIAITMLFIKADWLTNLLILISAFSFITNIFGIIDIYFQSQVLAKKTVKIQIISLIITSILKLLFILLKLGLVYFAVIYVIDGLIIAIGLIFAYKKTGFGISKWKFNKKIIYSLLLNSWPLMLSGIAFTIYMKIDQVMIKNMIGNESSGLYAIAVKLSEFWYFIPTIICESLFTAIINARNTNLDIYKKRLKNLFLMLIIISIGIALLITVFSKLIIATLFGKAYMGTLIVLRTYVWSSIPIFLQIALGNYLVSENLVKIELWSTIGGAVLNVVLNIFLIPKYGIEGAAIATLISYTYVLAFVLISLKIKRG